MTLTKSESRSESKSKSESEFESEFAVGFDASTQGGPAPEDGTLYAIVVRGRLDELWVARLSWMTVAHRTDDSGHSVTLLTGRVPDQSALIGVICALSDLGMELVQVKVLQEVGAGEPVDEVHESGSRQIPTSSA